MFTKLMGGEVNKMNAVYGKVSVFTNEGKVSVFTNEGKVSVLTKYRQQYTPWSDRTGEQAPSSIYW